MAGCSLDGAVKLNHGLTDIAVNWSGNRTRSCVGVIENRMNGVRICVRQRKRERRKMMERTCVCVWKNVCIHAFVFLSSSLFLTLLKPFLSLTLVLHPTHSTPSPPTPSSLKFNRKAVYITLKRWRRQASATSTTSC